MPALPCTRRFTQKSKPEMSDSRILVYQLSLPVRWADMDINAHVNNTRYFTYFEAVRLAWFDAIGVFDRSDGHGTVVAQTTCTYRRSIPYPETVKINLHVGPPGRSSYTTYYELLSEADTSILYADGQAVMVWVDRATGLSRPLPDSLRAALAPPLPAQENNV